MRKLKLTVSALAVCYLSACSLGGSSETVIGGFNFAPAILNNVTDYQAVENQVTAFTVSATDPDLDPLTLEISGTDAAQFTHLGGGVIEFAAAPDFEAPADADGNNIYEIIITVTDGEKSDMENFTVEVTDDPADNAAAFAKCGSFSNASGAVVPNYQSCTVTQTEHADRTFTLYVPPAYDARKNSVPLLMSLHEYGSHGHWNLLYTGFQKFADQEGFIIAYPQGSVLETTGETHWDVDANSTIDDFGYLGVVADYLGATYDINADKVYAAGMSNGGSMSLALGCHASDRFAAIGSVAGSMASTTGCAPSRAVPVMQIHGKMDPAVPFAGSAINMPVHKVSQFWARTNNCAMPGAAKAVTSENGLMGGTHTAFDSCKSGASVETYLMDDLAHSWPNGEDINAAEKLWGFMSGFDLNGAAE